jgi:hypothetical protein
MQIERKKNKEFTREIDREREREGNTSLCLVFFRESVPL